MTSKSDMNAQKRKSANGAGIAVGIAVGVALGAAFDQLALGIAFGTAFGAVLEIVSHAKRKKRP